MPALIAIVVYHGRRAWSPPTRLRELLDLDPEVVARAGDLVGSARLLVDDLGQRSDRQLRARGMDAFGALVCLLLRDGRRGGLLRRLPAWVDLFAALRRGPGASERRQVIEYLLSVPERLSHAGLQRFLDEHVDLQAKEMAMTIADQLRKEGRKEGLRRALLRQLELRFGELPVTGRRRVRSASTAQLEAWIERVLVAGTLEDVLGHGNGV